MNIPKCYPCILWYSVVWQINDFESTPCISFFNLYKVKVIDLQMCQIGHNFSISGIFWNYTLVFSFFYSNTLLNQSKMQLWVNNSNGRYPVNMEKVVFQNYRRWFMFSRPVVEYWREIVPFIEGEGATSFGFF